MTQILLKRSATAGNVPLALAAGEVAINLSDGFLFWADNGGTVQQTPLKSVATQAFVTAAINALIAGAPGALNTLKELADALGDDPNYATTVATALGNRVRSDAVQNPSAAQRSIIWQNIGYPAPTSFSTGTAIAASDVARDFRFSSTATASATLSLPSSAAVSPGFATGVISNECLGYTMTVTLANSADKLEADGVLSTNGTLTVLPRQKVTFYLDTDGWHTVWQDRTPIVFQRNVPAGTASFDWAVPAGYSQFEYTISDFVPSAAGGGLFLRVSNNGGTSFRSGSGDYYHIYSGQAGGSAYASGFSASGLTLIYAAQNTTGVPGLQMPFAHGKISSKYFHILQEEMYEDATPNHSLQITSGFQNPSPNAPITGINYARFLNVSNAATFSCNVNVRGLQ